MLRTVSPSADNLRGRVVTGFRRLAKQIVFELEGDFFIVIHLMIAADCAGMPGGGPSPGAPASQRSTFPPER